MHDFAGIGITVATILAATFFSNQAANALRTEMRLEINSLRTETDGLRSEPYSLRSDIMSRLNSIQRDMREFYAEQVRHDARIASLEQRLK